MTAKIVDAPVHRPTISERLERSLLAYGGRWAVGVLLFVWALILGLIGLVA